MTQFGYALSSEEHPPLELVRQAERAERAGFTFALISDHYHPWTDRQGQSGFVWSVLGAIAHATRTLRVGTGVTCPLVRLHPAIVAKAAATVATLMPGRFFLGLGTGENLNEHVVGARWPEPRERLVMLEEAVEVIRALWTGEKQATPGRPAARSSSSGSSRSRRSCRAALYLDRRATSGATAAATASAATACPAGVQCPSSGK